MENTATENTATKNTMGDVDVFPTQTNEYDDGVYDVEDDLERTPPPLLRSLSAQHIRCAIHHMIDRRLLMAQAGFHRNSLDAGFTRWYVLRPSVDCEDLASMHLLTVTMTPDGRTISHMQEMCDVVVGDDVVVACVQTQD